MMSLLFPEQTKLIRVAKCLQEGLVLDLAWVLKAASRGELSTLCGREGIVFFIQVDVSFKLDVFC